MLQHLLYVVAPSQIDPTIKALGRLDARPLPSISPITTNFEVRHKVLGSMILHISLLSDLDGIAPHMRQNPVDLLVHDERGPDGIDAITALEHIRRDVNSLAHLWGPDFLFPMSRIVVVLREEEKQSHKVFDLGHLAIRDVIVAPKNTAILMRWIKEVLSHGIARKNRVGLALSGGGMEGFLYQIGVLHALDAALSERTMNEIDMISGISSGAIIGGMLGVNIPAAEVIRSLHKQSDKLPPFTSNTIFDLAGAHILRRVARELIQWKTLNPSRWISNVLRSFPTGFFKGDNLEAYFKAAIDQYGGHDAFDKVIKPRLFIGATDQDSFEHVVFGEPPWDKIAISAALRASCSLPPLFAPKTINGRMFIDGQVTRSCNLEILVEKGCHMVFVVDPLKPASTPMAGSLDRQGGLFGIIQTVKALISTRFEANLRHVSEQFPDVDFIIFQPDEDCARLMAGSPMRYRIRTQLIELAYKSTLRKLRERHHVYSVKMGRYGFVLKTAAELKDLEDNYHEVFQTVA